MFRFPCAMLATAGLMLLATGVRAQMHRFESADGTKDFVGELKGFDPKTQLVSVMIKRRIQTFKIGLLSKEDQAYVMERGERLAVVRDLDISLDSFTGKSVKRQDKKARTEDRVYPSGYEIKISNRSRRNFENLKLRYTIYYGVQDYLQSDRVTKKTEGELLCKMVTGLGSTTFQTETVEIISGKMEPLIENRVARNADGSTYVQSIIKEPGGRRKDQLIGCTVNLIIDDEIVKTVTKGKIQLQKEKEEL